MRYFVEDFQPGHRFVSGPLLVEAPRIKSFASELGTQAFHLDEDRTRDSAHSLHQQHGVHDHG